MDDQTLLAIARKTLGRPADDKTADVHRDYLGQLKSHLVHFPHDHHFILNPYAGPDRLGTIRCLEAACKGTAIIALGPRQTRTDGGRSIGIGGLGAFQSHIQDDDLHEASRNKRVAEEKRKQSSSSVTSAVPNKAAGSSLRRRESLKEIGNNSSSSSMRDVVGRYPGDKKKDAKPQPQRPSLSGAKKHPFLSSYDAVLISDSDSSDSDSRCNPKPGSRSAPPAASMPATPPGATADQQARLGRLVRQEQQWTALVEMYALTKNQAKLETAREKVRGFKEQQEKLKQEIKNANPPRKKTAAINFFGGAQAGPAASTSAAPSASTLPFDEQFRRLQEEADRVRQVELQRRRAEAADRAQEAVMRFQAQRAELEKRRQQALVSASTPAPTSSASTTRHHMPKPRSSYPFSGVPPGLSSDGDVFDAMIDGLYQNDGDYSIESLARDRDRDRDAYDAAYGGGGGAAAVMSEADRREFFARAVDESDLSENATVQRARETLGLTEEKPRIDGMEVALLPHQVLGVEWGWQKEREPKDRGGLLGDEMGLGKTIQMTAIMLKNRPGKIVANSKRSTLIIAPLALLRQWKEELMDKTSVYKDSDILIYHGSKKPKRVGEICKHLVVLTTFQTMALEWPDPLKEERREKARQAKKRKDPDASDSDDWISDDDGKKNKGKGKGKGEGGKDEAGPLFAVDWYRIVLDEAHNIRNRQTRASRAAADLTAEHRWCLTGTPLVNACADFYGYVRFLGTPHWRVWPNFNTDIAKIEKKQPNRASKKLQVILKICMLRRKKDSTLDGKPLIELPTKTIENIDLQFSQDEREIYQAVEAQAQAQFNKFLKAGTVLKNYSTVLTMLLRLRQLCAHPALITEYRDSLVAEEEVAQHNATAKEDLQRAKDMMGITWVNRMKAKCRSEIDEMMAAEAKSEDAVGAECPICSEPLGDNAKVTPCPDLGHIFCQDCLDQVFAAPNNADDDTGGPNVKDDERLCPTCRNPFALHNTMLRDAFMPLSDAITVGLDLPDEDSMDVDPQPSSSKGKMKRAKVKKVIPESEDDDLDDETLGGFIVHEGDASDGDSDYAGSDAKGKRRRQPNRSAKGKKKARLVVADSDDEGAKEEDEQSEAEEAEDEDEKPVWIEKGRGRGIFSAADMPKIKPRHEPSAKMIWLGEEIERIWLESPDDKILILSQWTSMLDLLDAFLASKDYSFCRFQGDMNSLERHEAVRAFQTLPQIKIMLMSLKAGGVGLNLTAGNRCISLDLAWSPSVEAQAQDRLHRLGQTKEVVVKRAMIAETVEQRICALQERKQGLADNSFGEGKGKRLGRLTVGDLVSLFSTTYRGARDDDD